MSGAINHPDDQKLSRAVKSLLWRSEPIRATDLDRIQVIVRQGIVTLRGLVSSETHSFAAVQIARRVRGVKDVVNELVTDEELMRRVGSALAASERTRHLQIAISVRNGRATLHGVVPTLLESDLARSIALGVPDVVGVDSRLRVMAAEELVILVGQESLEGRPPARRSDQS